MWFTFFAYDTREALVRGDWDRLKWRAEGSPWGMVLFLQAAVIQLLLGPGRLSVLSLNLIYYVLAQVATFWFFSRVAKSYLAGLVSVLLFMALQSPFRGGLAVNMRDFHHDLVLYFLLVVAFYLIAWSGVFKRRVASVLVGAFAAYVVSIRLVSASLFGAACGAFFLVLLVRYFLGARQRRVDIVERIWNFLISTGVFVALSAVPVLIARKALYAHYLRYIFEPEFREARVGLYAMGPGSKLAESYALAKVIFVGDFGVLFMASLAALVLWAACQLILRRRCVDARQQTGPPAQDPPSEGAWHADPLVRRLFAEFLLCAIMTSYLMHVAYPITSDHMTRATTAPVFILCLLYLLPWLNRTLLGPGRAAKLRTGGVLAVALAGALITQCRFYLRPGRYHDRKKDFVEIARMFEDVGHIADSLKTESVAVSVDFVEAFALGSLLNYSVYRYEHHGLLREVSPKLGFPIDEPVNADKAMELLSASDVVILARDDNPADQWPLTKSVRPMRKFLRTLVEGQFLYHGSYQIRGMTKDLYRRRPWTVKASASTAPEYGPELLLEEAVRIWHAPWNGKDPQWVSFTALAPVRLRKLVIVAQDGGPTRAPRTFAFQASSDGQTWKDILNVADAGFSAEAMTRQWVLPEMIAYRHFRLYVTANNGAPTLLTIWNMQLHMAGPPR